jgi:hypothetical protein
MADKMTVTILKDGTVKISTDEISLPNHGNAEMLLGDIAARMGGEVDRVEKGNLVHTHENGMTHSH